MELAKERAHLGAECTEDEEEQEAAWCQNGMSSVLNATAKKIRISAKSKKWWNANIKKRSNAVGREKKQERDFGGGRQGTGRGQEVDSAVQEQNVQ